jgi:hypothetical protein
MLTTVLELIGVTCLAAFAFLVWPPLALVAVGAAALVLSWVIEHEPKGRRK